MHDRERSRLLHGPYEAPRCRIGKPLFCELRGWVPMRGMSAGRISWPRTKIKKAWALILCGDLVRAVKREAAIAVAHWWGVTSQTVTLWRKALNVGPYTEGTVRLHREWTPERIPPEVHARGVAAASTPEANAKKAIAKRGHAVSAKAARALARGRRRCQ